MCYLYSVVSLLLANGIHAPVTDSTGKWKVLTYVLLPEDSDVTATDRCRQCFWTNLRWQMSGGVKLHPHIV